MRIEWRACSESPVCGLARAFGACAAESRLAAMSFACDPDPPYPRCILESCAPNSALVLVIRGRVRKADPICAPGWNAARCRRSHSLCALPCALCPSVFASSSIGCFARSRLPRPAPSGERGAAAAAAAAWSQSRWSCGRPVRVALTHPAVASSLRRSHPPHRPHPGDTTHHSDPQ